MKRKNSSLEKSREIVFLSKIWNKRKLIILKANVLRHAGNNLRNKASKMWIKGDKFFAKGSILFDTGNKLWAEGGILRSKGTKQIAEADIFWSKAVFKIFGNVSIIWRGNSFCIIDHKFKFS